jgi:hypothetical protein
MLLQMLREQVELLAVQVAAGATVEQLEETACATKAAFLAEVQQAGLQARSESIKMIRLLADSQFQGNHRTDIIDAIMGITGEGPTRAKQERQQSQSHSHFNNYPSKPMAELLANVQTPYRHKVNTIGTFLANLGATNLNEPSWCLVVATWYACEAAKHTEGNIMDASEAYGRVQDLKAWMHACRGRGKLPHYGTITLFPSEPNWRLL